ncbi:uncharacterized protein [Melanerpes formicivorus]
MFIQVTGVVPVPLLSGCDFPRTADPSCDRSHGETAAVGCRTTGLWSWAKTMGKPWHSAAETAAERGYFQDLNTAVSAELPPRNQSLADQAPQQHDPPHTAAHSSALPSPTPPGSSLHRLLPSALGSSLLGTQAPPRGRSDDCRTPAQGGGEAEAGSTARFGWETDRAAWRNR